LIDSLLTTKGRVNRSRFLAHIFVYSIPFALYALFIGNYLDNSPAVPELLIIALEIIVILPFILFTPSIAIRRAHDFNEDGLYALMLFVPFINLYFLFAPGTPTQNRYGAVPSKSSRTILFLAGMHLAWPIMLLTLVSLVPEANEFIFGASQ